MKKLFLALIVVLFSFGIANASPWLTENPYVPAADGSVGIPESYNVSIDGGAAVVSPVKANTDGSVQLWYDLQSLANGKHTVVYSAFNIWGEAAKVTYSFTKAPPVAHTGTRITK